MPRVWSGAGAGAAGTAVTDPLPALLGAALLGAAAFAWLAAAGAGRGTLVIAAFVILPVSGYCTGRAARAAPSLLLLADTPQGLAYPWRIRGAVHRAPEPVAAGSTFTVDIAEVLVERRWRPWTGRVQIRVAEPASGLWSRGRCLEVFLTLRRDRPAANPGLAAARGAARAYDARASLKSYRQLRPRCPPPAPSALTLPGRTRAAIRDALAAHVPRHAGVARALILGERGGLSDRTRTDMAGAGLIHLLALSGLHVAILLGVVTGAARAVGAAPALARAAGIAALAVTLGLVVPRAPIQRAGMMAATVWAAGSRGRKAAGLDVLALAVFALAVHDPRIVRDPGFQMSVAATGAIVAVGRDSRTPAGWPARALRASVAAQLAAAPLVAARAHEIALGAVLLNLVAIPIVSAAVTALIGTLAIHAAGVGSLAGALGSLADRLLGVLAWLAGTAASVDWLRITLPGIGVALAAAYWCGLALTRRRSVIGAAIGWALVLLAAVAAARPPTMPAVPELVALDVGQGDAILMRRGSDGVLVDAGGYPGVDYDTGMHIVAPVLRHLGVRRLSVLAATHAHTDHAGGLAAVIERFPVDQLWVGATPPSNRLLARVLASAADNAVVALTPRGHRRLLGCDWRVLPPPVHRLLAGAVAIDNDASLALGVACERRRVLLTGDAGYDTERAWDLRGLRGAVLKVGHHGSASSSSPDLLARLNPRHAILSVGARNAFGLPRTEVLTRLRDRGIAVYRTDRDGAIRVTLGPRVRVRGQRWRAGRR